MCFRDLVDELNRLGVSVSDARIRWAIKTGKVSRPPLDGSLRFNFAAEHVGELAEHFQKRTRETARV